MTRQIPVPVRLFHITHFENLAGIAAAGGLFAKKALPASAQSIAYENIQERRARKRVPCGPEGTLHDYVPFYFAPRSPMLYTINRGNVPSCPEGQVPIMHLATTVDTIQQAGLDYVFTGGHAAMAFTSFFTDLADLVHIDWPLMEQHMCNDTPQDPNRSWRRQAEFLVHRFVPWTTIQAIGVCTPRIKAEVERALGARVTSRPCCSEAAGTTEVAP